MRPPMTELMRFLSFMDRRRLCLIGIFGCVMIPVLLSTVLAQSNSATPTAPNNAAQPSSSGKSSSDKSSSDKPSSDRPAFDDAPHFEVSGVKDTSALGGHGSDVTVRESNALAKETSALGKKDAAAQPASAAALDSLREKTEHDPDNAALHHMLADAEEKSGDSLAAVREYQRAAELDVREEYIFDWGSELLLHHAAEPALEVFAKGYRVAPQSARMLIGWGAAGFAFGDYNLAMEKIGAASDLNPSDPIPYLFLSKLLDPEAAPPEALVEKLHRFVSLQPDRADANYDYALALWQHRRDLPTATAKRVETLLSRALQLDPNYAAAYLQRGILYAETGDPAKATADYLKAIAIDPQNEEAHYRLAQAYRRIGQVDKAKDEIKAYEQLSKESDQQAERERHEIQQFVYTLRDGDRSGKQ